jgi:hypothetical protein
MTEELMFKGSYLKLRCNEEYERGRRDAIKEIMFLIWPNPKKGVSAKRYSEYLYNKCKELLEDKK